MCFAIIPAFLTPLLIALFGAGFASYLLWHQKEAALLRNGVMSKLAHTLGLTFSAEDSFGLARQLQGFELFERERTRWFNQGKISNVMRGLVGETDVYLFDYTFTVQAGKSRKPITQTVFFANDKNWYLPDFHLKPESFWHKFQAMVGLEDDIDFAENPEFSDKYWLISKYEDLIRQQFTPKLQGFLMEKPPAHLEGNNYYLIAYKPRQKMQAAEAQVFFSHCCEIVQLLQEKGAVELLNLAELKKEKVPVPREL